jgi:hypothetical protein
MMTITSSVHRGGSEQKMKTKWQQLDTLRRLRWLRRLLDRLDLQTLGSQLVMPKNSPTIASTTPNAAGSHSPPKTIHVVAHHMSFGAKLSQRFLHPSHGFYRVLLNLERSQFDLKWCKV